MGCRSNKRGGGARKGARSEGVVVFGRRVRSCPLSGPQAPSIDYKDAKLLMRFISERGKIVPSRVSGVCARKQRRLAVAIKRARELAIIPYVN